MVTEERLQQLEETISKKMTRIAVGSAVFSGGLSLAGMVYTFMSVNKKPCGCELPKAKPVEPPEQRARNRRARPSRARRTR